MINKLRKTILRACMDVTKQIVINKYEANLSKLVSISSNLFFAILPLGHNP